jgi:hypothetical protein
MYNALPAYVQILGTVSELHRHHPIANRRERGRACRCHHFCSQEQAGAYTFSVASDEPTHGSMILINWPSHSDLFFNSILKMQDITLGVALGSATQISMFVVGITS